MGNDPPFFKGRKETPGERVQIDSGTLVGSGTQADERREFKVFKEPGIGVLFGCFGRKIDGFRFLVYVVV